MHDAGLDLRLWKDGVDRLRKALQAADHRDQDVFHATVLEFGHHAQPELGTFRLLDPYAQNFLGAIGAHAQCQGYRFVSDLPSPRILTHKASKETSGYIDSSGLVLPFNDFFHHFTSDGGNQVGRHFQTVQFRQMPLDLAYRQAARIERNHRVVKAWQATLVFGDQMRLKAAIEVARDIERELVFCRSSDFLLLPLRWLRIASGALRCCSRR